MTALRVRPPAVAGSFYPADPSELRAELARLLAGGPGPGGGGGLGHDGPPEQDGGAEPWPPPKAIVAPHAGYVYSGPVAATAWAALLPLRGRVNRVVLLGPSHRVALEGMAVPTADVLETPLGPVRGDTAGCRTVLDVPGVVEWDAPHAQEHSLEVHLPFIQEVLGDVAVLAIVVGSAPASEVADVLDAVWGGPETVIVVSTDLSHYHDHATATAVDRRTASAIEAGRIEDIGPHDACGAYPLRGLLVAAQRRGLSARTIDLRTSGDTAGDHQRVVGYGAFCVGACP